MLDLLVLFLIIGFFVLSMVLMIYFANVRIAEPNMPRTPRLASDVEQLRAELEARGFASDTAGIGESLRMVRGEPEAGQLIVKRMQYDRRSIVRWRCPHQRALTCALLRPARGGHHPAQHAEQLIELSPFAISGDHLALELWTLPASLALLRALNTKNHDEVEMCDTGTERIVCAEVTGEFMVRELCKTLDTLDALRLWMDTEAREEADEIALLLEMITDTQRSEMRRMLLAEALFSWFELRGDETHQEQLAARIASAEDAGVHCVLLLHAPERSPWDEAAQREALIRATQHTPNLAMRAAFLRALVASTDDEAHALALVTEAFAPFARQLREVEEGMVYARTLERGATLARMFIEDRAPDAEGETPAQEHARGLFIRACWAAQRELAAGDTEDPDTAAQLGEMLKEHLRNAVQRDLSRALVARLPDDAPELMGVTWALMDDGQVGEDSAALVRRRLLAVMTAPERQAMDHWVAVYVKHRPLEGALHEAIAAAAADDRDQAASIHALDLLMDHAPEHPETRALVLRARPEQPSLVMERYAFKYLVEDPEALPLLRVLLDTSDHARGVRRIIRHLLQSELDPELFAVLIRHPALDVALVEQVITYLCVGKDAQPLADLLVPRIPLWSGALRDAMSRALLAQTEERPTGPGLRACGAACLRGARGVEPGAVGSLLPGLVTIARRLALDDVDWLVASTLAHPGWSQNAVVCREVVELAHEHGGVESLRALLEGDFAFPDGKARLEEITEALRGRLGALQGNLSLAEGGQGGGLSVVQSERGALTIDE